MKFIFFLVAINLFSLSLTSCSMFSFSRNVDEDISQEGSAQKRAVAQSQMILKPLKKKLMKSLYSYGADTHAAVEFCAKNAQTITQTYEKKVGGQVLGLGRSSHKVRNPLNAPEVWLKNIITQMENSSSQSPQEPVLIDLPDDEAYGYVEPIYMKGTCLRCHGNNIVKKIKDEIAHQYIQDQAVDFSLGDFRGVFWVKLRKTKVFE